MAVLGASPVLDVELRAVLEQRLPCFEHPSSILGVDFRGVTVEGQLAHFLRAEPEHAFDVGCDERQFPVLVDGPDHVGNALDEQTVPLLRFAERFFRRERLP